MIGNDTVYLAGNLEAQKLVCYNINLSDFIAKHFLYSVLLSDIVLMPSGSAYQSKYTLNLTKNFYDFFFPFKNELPLSAYAIGADKGSFYNDALEKSTWFPKGYGIYTDKQAIYEISKILTMEPLTRQGKMRNVLTNHIKHEISDDGKSKSALKNYIGAYELTNELVKPLAKVIEVQKFAILPEYVHMEMRDFSNNAVFKKWLDFILYKSYSLSCSETYSAYCNNPLSIYYEDIFRKIYPYVLDYRDTLLFETFLEIFPLKDIQNIKSIDLKQIHKIKTSDKFRSYLSGYIKIVSKLASFFKDDFVTINPYKALNENIKSIVSKEKQTLKNVLITDTNESLVFYKSLKYSFNKFKSFNKWVKNNIYDDLPTIKILEYMDLKKDSIINEYIKGLYQICKNNQWERKVNMKKETSKKNTIVSFGGGNIMQDTSNSEQIINSTLGNRKSSLVEKTEFSEFELIQWGDIEKYIILIKEKKLDKKTEKLLIELLTSGKYLNEDSYHDKLNEWDSYKKCLSEKTKEILKVVAQMTSIASFILKLLGL